MCKKTRPLIADSEAQRNLYKVSQSQRNLHQRNLTEKKKSCTRSHPPFKSPPNMDIQKPPQIKDHNNSSSWKDPYCLNVSTTGHERYPKRPTAYLHARSQKEANMRWFAQAGSTFLSVTLPIA